MDTATPTPDTITLIWSTFFQCDSAGNQDETLQTLDFRCGEIQRIVASTNRRAPPSAGPRGAQTTNVKFHMRGASLCLHSCRISTHILIGWWKCGASVNRVLTVLHVTEVQRRWRMCWTIKKKKQLNYYLEIKLIYKLHLQDSEVCYSIMGPRHHSGGHVLLGGIATQSRSSTSRCNRVGGPMVGLLAGGWLLTSDYEHVSILSQAFATNCDSPQSHQSHQSWAFSVNVIQCH